MLLELSLVMSSTTQKWIWAGCQLTSTGVPLTDEALATAQKSDAVLLGAVGGVPEKTVGTNFTNLRPEGRAYSNRYFNI